jgi:hypothetical protein
MQRFIEMKCFRKYLQYLQLKKEYDANKVNAIKSLKNKKLIMFYRNCKNLANTLKLMNIGQSGVGHHCTIC